MISAMFAIAPAGKATAASISRLTGPTPVAGVWPICPIAIGIHGAAIQSDINLTMACRIITPTITESTSMSASADTGRVIIDIAGTTGMAATPIIGTAHMSSLNRIRT